MTAGEYPTAAALRRVAEEYGPHALRDPVALRAALRACAPDLPAATVDRLVTATADAPAAPVVPGPGTAAAQHLGWTDATGAPPIGTPDGSGAGGSSIRPAVLRTLVTAVVLTVVLAVIIVLEAGRSPAGGPAPDRFAPDQISGRYRALGAALLDGAVRCAPLPPEPGQNERIDCNFGDVAMILASYDTPSRLPAARDAATADVRGTTRRAAADGPGGTIALRQTATPELTETATVHWDAREPRPVSATVTSTRLSLPALAEFVDTRGFVGATRPEVPGAAFVSGVLWELATHAPDVESADCVGVPPQNRPVGAVEQVVCRFGNGVEGVFSRLRDDEELTAARASYASEIGYLPGTLAVGGWRALDEAVESDTQLIEYVDAAARDAHLYFDRRESLSFGVLSHPDLSQAELKELWVVG